MSTKAEKKCGFKETAGRAYRSTKEYASKKLESAKAYGRQYGSDVRTAYDVGYARGWEDAYQIPQRVGTRMAAAYGYGLGMKHRFRRDKYNAQYSRKGKKNR